MADRPADKLVTRSHKSYYFDVYDMFNFNFGCAQHICMSRIDAARCYSSTVFDGVQCMEY